MFLQILEQKNMSMYRLSKNTGIPYATIRDLCKGKSKIEKCNVETVYKISKELNITIEELLDSYFTRIDFELYKSNVCHELKEKGDIAFIISVLESNEIREFFNKKWYRESFYLLGLLDYISRINGIDICTSYDDIRRYKLEEPLFPKDVLLTCRILKTEKYKNEALKASLPEFLRFNIVEGDVRDVI